MYQLLFINFQVPLVKGRLLILVLGQNSLVESAKKLCEAVGSFTRKLNVVMSFILLKRYKQISSSTKELRYRRDIVFSQVVCRSFDSSGLIISKNKNDYFFRLLMNYCLRKSLLVATFLL